MKPKIIRIAGIIILLLLAGAALVILDHSLVRKKGSILPQKHPITSNKPSPSLLKGVHPVVDQSYRLLGGVVNGRWQDRSEVAALLKGGEGYRFFTRNRLVGHALGTKPKKEQYITGDIGFYIGFDNSQFEHFFAIAGD